MKRFWMLRGLKMLALVAFGAAALGFLVMSLWNWLLPAIAGWHSIGFVQALGLLLLSRILFGGFRGRGGAWRHRMRERFEQMTPQERERFRAGLRSRCGRDRGAPAGAA